MQLKLCHKQIHVINEILNETTYKYFPRSIIRNN